MESESSLAFAFFSLEPVAVTFRGLPSFPLVLSQQAQKFFPPRHAVWKPVLETWQSVIVPFDVVTIHFTFGFKVSIVSVPGWGRKHLSS